MEQLSTECIGVDISDKWCVIRGVDEMDDNVEVSRKTRVGTEADELRSYFETIEPTRVVMEASTHSPWISRLVADCGHDAFVVDPHRVQLISENKYKDDPTDAELLARLGRADIKLLNPIEHREENCQADLVKIRMRAVLVRVRSSLISTVRGTVKSFGGRIPSCSSETFGKKARDHLPELIRDTMVVMLSKIQALTTTIRRLDNEIEELIERRYPEANLLLQIDGAGPVTALCFILVLQDPERFDTNRQAGPYIGLAPGRNQSGDQDPNCRITKAGDKYLRKLLVQCAHWILNFGPDSDLKRHGEKLLERGGRYARQKAAVAVARKLAVVMLTLWRTGEDYQPLFNADDADPTDANKVDDHDADRSYRLDDSSQTYNLDAQQQTAPTS